MDFFWGIAGYRLQPGYIPQVEYTPGTGIPPATHTPGRFKIVQDLCTQTFGKGWSALVQPLHHLLLRGDVLLEEHVHRNLQQGKAY